MKGMDLLEAVGYVDQDLIEKTETAQNNKKRNLHGRWAILIAAAALVLCGTAAAGLLWNKPAVQVEQGSQTLLLNQGCVDLPDDAETAILASVVPERDYKAFLSFNTVEEWQAFFDLPFVLGPLAGQSDAVAQTDPNLGAYLVIEGSVDAMVSTEEQDGERRPVMMWSTFLLNCYGEEGFRWAGDMDIFAAFSEEAAASGAAAFLWTDETEESVTDYTTPSGIPCVIGRSVHDGGDRVNYCLYYGFESVLYRLRMIYPAEETSDAVEYLKEVADSLQIRYPAGS